MHELRVETELRVQWLALRAPVQVPPVQVPPVQVPLPLEVPLGPLPLPLGLVPQEVPQEVPLGPLPLGLVPQEVPLGPLPLPLGLVPLPQEVALPEVEVQSRQRDAMDLEQQQLAEDRELD